MIYSENTDPSLVSTARYLIEKQIPIAHKVWTLRFFSLPGFGLSWYEEQMPSQILVIGLLCSFLFSSLVFSLSNSRGIAVSLANRMTRNLRESEEQFRSLYGALSGGIIVINQEGVVTLANNEACEILNTPMNYLVGVNLNSPPIDMPVKHEDGSPLEMSDYPIVQTLRTGRPLRNIVVGIIVPDSSKTKWLNVNTEPIRDPESDQVKAVVSTFSDITLRKEAEETLRSSEARSRELLESSPDGIAIVQDLKMVYANTKLCSLLGYAPGDLTGQDALLLAAPYDRDRLRETSIKRAQGLHVPQVYEVDYLHKNGTIVPCELNVSRINYDGKPAALAHIRDISQRKRSEEELLKVQKLESLGIMAGGIAHDFNNLLTAITGTVALAKLQIERDHPVHSLLSDAEKATQRAENLAMQLLTFSKGGSPIKKLIELPDLIRDAGNLALIGTNVKAEYEFATALAPVEVDEGQISQVINNLFINAVQAMPQGGFIHAQGENMVLGAGGQPNNFPIPDGPYVHIYIQDQGCGIPESYLKKIFDPFFTTKPKGSGLGLATSFSIIKKHNGHITVESQVKKGTTFHIFLPAIQNEKPSQSSLHGRIMQGTGKILVMDDEEMIRNIAGKLLQFMGYEAEFARDGAEAVEIYRNALEKNSPYQAVIMDLTVPGGVGGREATQKLLELDPKAKVIVSSGYSHDPVMANFQDYGFKAVVTKPYDLTDLSQKINSVIRDVPVNS